MYSHTSHLVSLGEGSDVNFLDQTVLEVGKHFLAGQLCERQKEMTLL